MHITSTPPWQGCLKTNIWTPICHRKLDLIKPPREQRQQETIKRKASQLTPPLINILNYPVGFCRHSLNYHITCPSSVKVPTISKKETN